MTFKTTGGAVFEVDGVDYVQEVKKVNKYRKALEEAADLMEASLGGDGINWYLAAAEIRKLLEGTDEL